MDNFKWQHSNEKILLKRHEHFLSILLRNVNNLLLVLFFSLIIAYIYYLIQKSTLIPVLIIITPFIITLFFIVKFYNETYIIFTDKRILKSVRNGLFSSHSKELTNDNIKQVTTANNWILWRLFNYWNIEVRWYDEIDTIYFKAIKENKDISIYVSRVISYIKENWTNDEIKRYISKKKRK